MAVLPGDRKDTYRIIAENGEHRMAHGVDQAVGSGASPRPRDREAEEALIPAEVLEQLLALDASYQALEHSGQISLELHYHQGKRKKVWVRCGAVYDVKEA